MLGAARAAGDITDSLTFAIAGWTRKLPAQMREETDRILLGAAAAGASIDDLATIAACAIEALRRQPTPMTRTPTTGPCGWAARSAAPLSSAATLPPSAAPWSAPCLLGEDGYLTGTDAETAACDAQSASLL